MILPLFGGGGGGTALLFSCSCGDPREAYPLPHPDVPPQLSIR